MKATLKLANDQKTPKYQLIVNSVLHAIMQGELKKGDQLFSINEFSDEFFLSRDTVQKAYEVLRKKGIITSVRGKGYFIHKTDVSTSYSILLLFNKISNYKKQVYNSFVEALGENAMVDLKIYHFNAKIFESLIANGLLDYDYFVIMPHFYENTVIAEKAIKMIPTDQLVILDKDISFIYSNYAAVYQDFRQDIFEALLTAIDPLKKYKKLFLVQPEITPYPPEITLGFRNFCLQENFDYAIIHEIEPKTIIKKGEAYIVIEETDLVNLIKNCKQNKFMVGKDVGIISCNETPLKEILLDGITVISTDHAKMGETAAKLILENKKEKIKNPFKLILRKSL